MAPPTVNPTVNISLKKKRPKKEDSLVGLVETEVSKEGEGVQQPLKKTRRGPKELLKALQDGDSNVSQCPTCQKCYTLANGHNCKGLVESNEFDTNIRCVKLALSAALTKDKEKQDERAKIKTFLNDLVTYHHAVIWKASRGLLGFLLSQLPLYPVYTKPLIELNVIKQMISFCSEAGYDIGKHEIKEYYQNVFNPLFTDFDIVPSPPCGRLSDTVFQCSAKQLLINFQNMMQAQYQGKTKQWIRHCLRDVQNPQTKKRLTYLCCCYAFNPQYELEGKEECDEIPLPLIVSLQTHCRQIPFQNTKAMNTRNEIATRQLIWLYYIQTKMKPASGKSFAHFPLVGFVPGHVTVEDKLMQYKFEKDWKTKYFKKKWTRHDRFWSKFSTDGVSISFQFNRQVQKNTIPMESKQNEDFYLKQDDFEKNSNWKQVVTIDTGRRHFITAASCDMEELTSSSMNTPLKYNKVSISNKEWQHMRRTDSIRQYMEFVKNKISTEKHKCLLSLKGSNHTVFLESMKSILTVTADYFPTYSVRNVRKAHLKSYSMSQLAFPKLNQKLLTKLGLEKENTLLVIGDGKFNHASSGHHATPTGMRLHTQLQKLYGKENVRWVDEFRTSKCCSLCGGDTAGMEAVETKRDKATGEMVSKKVNSVWGLRACWNEHCSKSHPVCTLKNIERSKPREFLVWDRDVNACLNMFRLCGSIQKCNDRPQHLCRQNQQCGPAEPVPDQILTRCITLKDGISTILV